MRPSINRIEKMMQLRARKAGLILKKGYQRYMYSGWGFVKDDWGNRIIGYQLYDPQTGTYVYGSYNETITHCLTSLEDVAAMIASIHMEENVR